MFAKCAPSIPGAKPRTLHLVAGHARSQSSSPDSLTPRYASSRSASSGPLSEQQMEDQLSLFSPVDVFRQNLLGPKAVIRSRDINYRLDRQQQDEAARQRKHYAGPPQRIRDFDSRNDYSMVKAMDLLRFQIRACRVPEEVVRVVTVALRNPEGTALITTQQIQRLIALVLESKETAARRLGALNILLHRFEQAKAELDVSIIFVALKTAASLHAVTAFKKWLYVWHKYLQDHSKTMSPVAMQEVLGLLLQGFNDKTSPTAVLQILYGFKDDMEQEDYSLGSYYLASQPDGRSQELWVKLLARCRAKKEIQEEWSKFSKAKRQNSQALQGFIQAFISIGQADEAWKIFKDHGHLITAPNGDELWQVLMDDIQEHDRDLTDLPDQAKTTLEEGLTSVLETRLATLEDELGVRWVQPDSSQQSKTEPQPAEGHHEFLDGDPLMESTLARLSKSKDKERAKIHSKQTRPATRRKSMRPKGR